MRVHHIVRSTLKSYLVPAAILCSAAGTIFANGLPSLSGPPTELLRVAAGSVVTHLYGTPVKDGARTDAGVLFVATDGKGVGRLDQGTWTFLPTRVGNRTADRVSDLILLDNRVWIAGEEFGVGRLDGDTWTEMPEASSKESPDQLLRVHAMEAFRGRIWISTDDGLMRWTEGSGFEPVERAAASPEGRVTTLYNHHNELLFCGTNLSELCWYDGKAWIREDFKGKLKGGVIRAIYQDPNWIWFGTFGALYMWSPTLKTLHDETKLQADLFKARIITSLAGDSKNALVGTAGGGVLRFAIAQATFRIHDKSNGLAGTIVNRIRIFGDTAVVAMSNGVSVIDLAARIPGVGEAPITNAPGVKTPPEQSANSPGTASASNSSGTPASETTAGVIPDARPVATNDVQPGPAADSPSNVLTEVSTAVPSASPSVPPVSSRNTTKPSLVPRSGEGAMVDAPLPPSTRPPEVATGEYLFKDPQILGARARSLNISCDSCHPWGNSNPSFELSDGGIAVGGKERIGMVDLTHNYFSARANDFKDNPRPIPHLFRLAERAPYGTEGLFPSLRDYIRFKIVVLLDGPEPSPRTLDSMLAFLHSLTRLDPPGLGPNGTCSSAASDSAKRGEMIFRSPLDPQGNFTCATCHVPSSGFTDGRHHDIGTGGRFRTPSLRGLSQKSRFFSSGAARSLDQVINHYAERFGNRGLLAQKTALVEYLRLVGQ